MMVVNLTAPQNNFFERTETLTRYYEDIRRYKPLTLNEELKLIKTYHTTTSKIEKKKVKDKLLCANQRFALGVARRWATNDNIMDLISEANIGMMEALEEYDIKNQSVKFITFAVYYIRRAINMYMIRNGCMIKKNNQAKTHHLLSQVINGFMQKEMRQPTLEEIAEILKNEHDVEIKDLGDVMAVQMSSIDEDYDEEDAHVGTMMQYNTASASENECEDMVEQDFAKKMVTSVLKKLTPNEQEVVKYVFGIEYDREYELQEIAEKMNFSTERIRQMKISALEKMKNEYIKLADSL